jgi:hypothetical protein
MQKKILQSGFSLGHFYGVSDQFSGGPEFICTSSGSVFWLKKDQAGHCPQGTCLSAGNPHFSGRHFPDF